MRPTNEEGSATVWISTFTAFLAVVLVVLNDWIIHIQLQDLVIDGVHQWIELVFAESLISGRVLQLNKAVSSFCHFFADFAELTLEFYKAIDSSYFSHWFLSCVGCKDQLPLNFFHKNLKTLSIEFDDDFWVKDISIPLDPKNANNSISTVIDSKKADCGRIYQIVFHGRAPIKLSDFTWVENGKLLLKNVKF